MNHTSPWVDRVTWIIAITTTLGTASLGASSWIVDALTKSAGMSPQDASLMSTVELVAMGTTMLLIAPVIHRTRHKALVLTGLTVAAAAQGVSAAVHGVLAMGSARVLSGIAFGAIYAVGAGSGAAAETPERAYATAASINMMLGMALNPPLGFGSQHAGYVGVFAALAMWCLLIGLPLVFIRFPPPRPRVSAAEPISETQKPRPQRTISVLLIMGLFAVATNGIFVFYVSTAARVGLHGTDLGTKLILVTAGAALGTALAGSTGQWAAKRFRWLWRGPWRGMPIFASMIAMGVACTALLDVHTAFMFLLTLTVWCVIYWIAYTLILGLAVAVDAPGRLAAAAGAVLVLMNGVGSAVAGYFAAHFGDHCFGLVALVICSIGALAGLLLDRSVERSSSLSSARAI